MKYLKKYNESKEYTKKDALKEAFYLITDAYPEIELLIESSDDFSFNIPGEIYYIVSFPITIIKSFTDIKSCIQQEEKLLDIYKKIEIIESYLTDDFKFLDLGIDITSEERFSDVEVDKVIRINIQPLK